MKKRCTESDCRKVFNYNKKESYVVCPFCGREYGSLGLKSQRLYCTINGKKMDCTFIKNNKEYFLGNKVKLVMAFYRGGNPDITPAGNRVMSLRQAKEVMDYFFGTGKLPVVILAPADGGKITISKAVKI